MKFGKQLLLKSNHAWADHYVSYQELKELIGEFRSSFQISQSNSAAIQETEIIGDKIESDTSCNDPVVNTKKDMTRAMPIDETVLSKIKHRILIELEKVNLFFINQELEAKRKFKELEDAWDENLTGFLKDEWIKNVHQFCRHLEDLQNYVSLNQTGFRKILKKYDRHLKTTLEEELGSVISEAYFSKSSNPHQLLLDAKKRLTTNLPRSPKRRISISGSLLTPQVPTFASLNLDALPIGLSRMWICLSTDGLSQPISVPVMIAKGDYTGPVLGITAALHGNELNGIPLIHRLFRELDSSQLSGAVVAVIVANIPGYLRAQRGFSDGTDLNRVFPGKETGSASQVYVYNLMENIINRCHYVLDLHTASLGRSNSLYVRTDMNNETTRRMARLQNPQIIVHNTGYDRSLRCAAVDRGIPAITVEIGNPQRFQERFIKFALIGVENILCSLEMVPREPERPEYEPIICSHSFWIFTTSGGILDVLPEVNTFVSEGDIIARVYTIFGDEKEAYHAPLDGIIIGKSINPVCQTGDRILHLGVFGDVFQRVSEDGHL